LKEEKNAHMCQRPSSFFGEKSLSNIPKERQVFKNLVLGLKRGGKVKDENPFSIGDVLCFSLY
jgi:hypothetical protein